MRVISSVASALYTVGAMVLLAGCYGSRSAATPYTPTILAGPRIATPSWSLPNAGAVTIYVSDFNSNVVTCFNEEGVVTGQITSGSGLSSPEGMTVHHGVLYVANPGARNVLEFNGCSATPIKTLKDPGQVPTDVAVTAKGKVFVSNITTTRGGPGSISVYTPSGVTPSGHLSAGATEGMNYFLTADAAGNIYSTWLDKSTVGHTECYPGGRAPGVDQGIRLTFPGGINVDPSGNLVIAQQGTGISTYTGGACVSGGWTETGTILSHNDNWVDIALDKSGKELNLTDITARTANSIAYPSGHADDVFTYTGISYPIGVANSGNAHD